MAKKNENTGLKAAVAFLGILLLLILFLVNSDKIISNIKQTQFFERVFGKGTTPEFIKNHKTKEEKKPESNGLLQVEVEPEKDKEENTETDQNSSPVPSETTTSQKEAVPESISKTEDSETLPAQETENTPPAAEKAEKQPQTPAKENNKPSDTRRTNVSLCFVTIDAAGSINRKEIVRSLPHTDIPLTEAINSLLQGPSLEDSNKGQMSLIPEGTKLLSASVKKGVAYLNFNDKFEFNSVGVEGYLGQLMQIVYTATAFQTVDSVQILIEGEKKDYLGSEGVWIGTPLARSSFD